MSRILVIGAGPVGSALGRCWLAAGHDVRFGVPDPAESKYADLPAGRVGPADDRGGAEIVVLATPYAAAGPALAALGDLAGAIVIDCTNPLEIGPEGLRLSIGHDTSGAEEIARGAPGAAVFKTLNQAGWETMTGAEAFPARPVMFVAGDDAEHKPAVTALVADLGLEAIDAGPLRAARLLEPLAMLWIDLAMRRGQGRDIAFALVRRAA